LHSDFFYFENICKLLAQKYFRLFFFAKKTFGFSFLLRKTEGF